MITYRAYKAWEVELKLSIEALQKSSSAEKHCFLPITTSAFNNAQQFCCNAALLSFNSTLFLRFWDFNPGQQERTGQCYWFTYAKDL